MYTLLNRESWYTLCTNIPLHEIKHLYSYLQILASASYDNTIEMFKEDDDDWYVTIFFISVAQNLNVPHKVCILDSYNCPQY